MSFYVYLPSNVKNFFHDNKTSSYVTNLANTLRLNNNYEVGLAEISFCKSWYNIPKDFEIMVNTDNGESHSNPKYVLRKGQYESFTEIFQIINKYLALYGNDIETKTKKILTKVSEILYDENTKKVTFNGGQNDNLCVIPHVDHELMEMFGFTLTDKRNFYSINNGIEYTVSDPEIFIDNSIKVSWESDRISDINSGVNEAYVYCSIIKPTFVGNTYAKLLRIVQIPNVKFGENVQKIYDNPHYFPISSSEINSIEINIKDATGENIKFNSGKAVVVLHFRIKNE
ncbi:MAG: hypothetical protein QM535_19305 [Limnohabitans sp.]|nr:hypothetical protein [Limnohabitans sp.]